MVVVVVQVYLECRFVSTSVPGISFGGGGGGASVPGMSFCKCKCTWNVVL